MDDFEVPLPMKKETRTKQLTTFEKVEKMFNDEDYDPLKPNDYHEILSFARKVDAEAAVRKKQNEYISQTPINLDITGEEAYKIRLQKTANSLGVNKTLTGESKAFNIMHKMGWNGFDSGLGKNQQGIKTPLMLQKKDGHSVVVPSTAIKEESQKGILITK